MHPTRQPSRPRTMLFSVPQQARTTLYLLTFLEWGSICGLGPDLVGIHSISLAARYRVAACSTALSQCLEKINTARGHNCTLIFPLSPIWEKEFLVPSPKTPRILIQHSCLRPRISGNLSYCTHTCSPAPKLPAYQSSKPDIRIFPMLFPQHVKEAMITVDGPGHFFRWRYSRR